jgi:hypothetical protein
MAKKINRKDRPINAYVANVIKHGKPFTIGKTLYFEWRKPKIGLVDGKLAQIGSSVQRVKARGLSG